MKNYIQKIKENKKTFLAMLIILIIGIFLRTYHYDYLLRFGKDQARDAALIQSITEGKAPLPLLGPSMNELAFRLGPIYYYLESLSAKIFGFAPPALAYPELLFSILTIPMLFFFLKKYFADLISIALTAVYAVSFYAVQNGRFAWNPNSLMLFSMIFLYAFLELADKNSQKKWPWAVLAGAAFGIGIQLHLLYAAIVSIVFVITAIYLIKKNLLTLKNIAFVLLVAFVLNIPQVVSEIQTHGGNIRAFFSGTGHETQNNIPFPTNIFVDMGWHAQADSMFVAPYGSDTKLHIDTLSDSLSGNKNEMKAIMKHQADIWYVSLGIILSLAGYILLFYYARKEKDKKKKLFLQIISLYAVIAFLIFIPLAHMLELRYLLIVQFLPFILLGLLIKFLEEKVGRWTIYLSLISLALLFAWNINANWSNFQSFLKGKGDPGIAIWGEEKAAGNFILAHSAPNQAVQMVYIPDDATKFVRPLGFFNESIQDYIVSLRDMQVDPPAFNKNDAYFALILRKKTERNALKREVKKLNTFHITNSASFGRLEVYKLELIR